MVGGRRVVGAIRSLVRLGVCSLSVLGYFMSHCCWLFLHIVNAMIWREKERSRISCVQRSGGDHKNG